MWRVTKTIPHAAGLSVCFRQWRAQHSHCSRLHGYALEIETVFESDFLDARNWVYDFGAYAPIRAEIFRTFDHALVVAEDDPLLDQFRELASAGAARVVVVQRVGCESFAHLIYAMTVRELEDAGLSPRVRVVSVTVREHGANAATYEAA